MWVALLRILIPVVIIVVVALGFIWPRYRKYREYNDNKNNMIEVEAEVVNSKQHDPTVADEGSASDKKSEASDKK